MAHDGHEAVFEQISTELLVQPGIDAGTGFGKNPGLRIGGRIFAMLVRGELVVKLPAERCAELVAAHDAEVFVVAKRRMREWATVSARHADRWPALAREALAHVGQRPG